MFARAGISNSQPVIAVRQVWPAALVASLLLWIGIVAARGILLALQSFGLPFAGEAQRNHATPQSIWAALLVYLFCLLAALFTRWLRPTATFPVTLAMGGVVVLTSAAQTGSVGSLITVLAMAALSWLVGDALLRRLPETADVAVVRLPVAIALGLVLIGLFLFLLASLTALNAVTVATSTGIILLLVLGLDRDRLRADLMRLRDWRPVAPSWFETVVLGMTVGLESFAMLSAFVPENTSDAIRQHLPIAREIWQSGSVREFPPMGASRDPIQGHLLYAVAWGFGGMTAAKLVHTLVGMIAIIGTAGVSWLGTGHGARRVAAVVSAAVLATMPVVLWSLGHAFLDLFPVAFTVTALLCILLWQRDGLVTWLIYAGALSAFGFTAKLTMGWVIVAIAAAIFLVGRRPWRVRDRIGAVLAFGLGATVVVPWLLRTYDITGTIPGLATLMEYVARILPAQGASASSITNAPLISHAVVTSVSVGLDLSTPLGAGAGRSLFDLFLIPWHLTFHGEQYLFPILGRGEVGVTLLMVLPLAFFGPRTRATAVLAVAAFASYVGWWFTPLHIARHLLPTLAITAALSGMGVANLVVASGPRRVLAVSAQIGVVAGILAAALLFLPSERTRVPVDLLTGRETAREYIAREIPLAAALAATSLELPPDTLVGYVGREWEMAQIYSEARLIEVAPGWPYESVPRVLSRFVTSGIHYVIWNRPSISPETWRSPLLSMSLLREHTRIIEGDGGGYLFEIRTGDGAGWDVPEANLLQDPELDRVGDDDGPWTTSGRVRAKSGVISMQPKSSVAQRIPIDGGIPYLLVASGQCPDPEDRAELVLRWFDADGVELGAEVERVYPGVEPSDQFLWHRAPEHAASVSAELTGSQCDFSKIGLYPSS